MSDFNKINDWVNANIKSFKKASDLTAQLETLKGFADSEDDNIKNFVRWVLREVPSQDTLDHFGGLKLNGYNPQAQYLENALSVVYYDKDLYSNDVCYSVFVIVPNYYVMRVLLRVDDKANVTSVGTSFKSYFQSSYHNPFVLHTATAGTVLEQIFEWKDKVDNKQKLDPEPEAPNQNESPDVIGFRWPMDKE